MTGCKSCGRSSLHVNSSAIQLPAINASNRPIPLLESDFVKMVYIGESGYVDSVVATLYYNSREHGSIMYVHKQDIKANPGLWVSIDNWEPQTD